MVKSNKVRNQFFKAFVEKHKDAEFVKACAAHWRMTNYGYIYQWLTKNGCKDSKVAQTTATNLMNEYRISFI